VYALLRLGANLVSATVHLLLSLFAV
jgi:hypothetical protein